LDPFLEDLFHLGWDVDRVPYRFHEKFLSFLIAVVKKVIRDLPPALKNGLRISPL